MVRSARMEGAPQTSIFNPHTGIYYSYKSCVIQSYAYQSVCVSSFSREFISYPKPFILISPIFYNILIHSNKCLHIHILKVAYLLNWNADFRNKYINMSLMQTVFVAAKIILAHSAISRESNNKGFLIRKLNDKCGTRANGLVS